MQPLGCLNPPICWVQRKFGQKGVNSMNRIDYNVGCSGKFRDFLEIEQRCNDRVDAESIQHLCLVSVPNEGRDFECIPFGMTK